MHPFRDDRLAICSFNHSGNSLLIYSCSKTRFFLMFWNMNNSDVLSGFEPEITEPKSVVLPLHHKTKCGNDRTRTYELRREEIYSLQQLPLCDTPISNFVITISSCFGEACSGLVTVCRRCRIRTYGPRHVRAML